MTFFKNMTDFADSLGLSRSAVSYILNGKWRSRKINPETAERVLAFAAKTNFTPNIFGQAIRGKISTDVAILLPSNAFEHHKQAFFEFIRVAREHDLSYLVFPLKNNSENQSTLTLMKNYRVKRAILIATSLASRKTEADWWREAVKRTPEIKWMFYDYRYSAASVKEFAGNVSFTGFDSDDAYRRVFDFIVKRGYGKMFCGVFRPDRTKSRYLKKIGLEYAGCETAPMTDDLFKTGRILGERLAKHDFRQTDCAIFISDDAAAIGAINFLREQGFAAPGDYNIISWDGLTISKYVSPPLTALEIPVSGMMEAVEAFMTGRPFERMHKLVPVLREGGTLPFRMTN